MTDVTDKKPLGSEKEGIGGENARTPPENGGGASGGSAFGAEPVVPCAHCGRTHGVIYKMPDIRYFDPLKPPSDPPSLYLHEACTQPFFACWQDGQDRPAKQDRPAEPGLSQGRIRELAHWYLDQAVAQREANRGTSGDVNSAELDSGLRAVLREEVLPEFVEVEFERVMQAVFAGV